MEGETDIPGDWRPMAAQGRICLLPPSRKSPLQQQLIKEFFQDVCRDLSEQSSYEFRLNDEGYVEERAKDNRPDLAEFCFTLDGHYLFLCNALKVLGLVPPKWPTVINRESPVTRTETEREGFFGKFRELLWGRNKIASTKKSNEYFAALNKEHDACRTLAYSNLELWLQQEIESGRLLAAILQWRIHMANKKTAP